MAETDRREHALLDLTNQPTAPAREDAVIAWVRAWVKRRRGVQLRSDRFGNLLIEPTAATSNRSAPLVLTAHMDHPAFVVREAAGRILEADFRGGVADRFFEGSPVRLWQDGEAVQTGTVLALHEAAEADDKRVTIQLNGPAKAQAGDIVTWRLPGSRITGDRLHAPVCDDLVGVAAALHAFDRLRRENAHKGKEKRPPLRLLLTRCEEIGFIGAMAACRSGLLPKSARVILMENSKSFADSPIGAGPIVRVGDRTSIFNPAVTYKITQLAEGLARRDGDFQFQRKLMPGGTCEATAYDTLGRAAACLCLPLGNYHNMNEQKGRIERETISLSDYHALVRLLIEIGRRLDDSRAGLSLGDRLDRLYQRRRHLLTGEAAQR
jgi:endoglucanase